MDMMHRPRQLWLVLLAAGVGLLILCGLAGTCAREPPVNSELARATRVAVESADDARRQNDAAYLWPGRLRLIVILIGVTVPLAAAVVLMYLATRHQADDVEVAHLLERHKLLSQPPVSETCEGDRPSELPDLESNAHPAAARVVALPSPRQEAD